MKRVVIGLLTLVFGLAVVIVPSANAVTENREQVSAQRRVSVNISHKYYSDLSSAHCRDDDGEYTIPRGQVRTGIMADPPRACWIPAGFRFTWNPIGPGIYYCNARDYDRWCSNPTGPATVLPWSATAIQIWYSVD